MEKGKILYWYAFLLVILNIVFIFVTIKRQDIFELVYNNITIVLNITYYLLEIILKNE